MCPLKKRGPILGSSRDFYFATRPNLLWGPSVFLSNGRMLLFLFSRVANLGLQFEYVSGSVDLKNICSYTSTCSNIYMASSLIKHRDNITLYILNLLFVQMSWQTVPSIKCRKNGLADIFGSRNIVYRRSQWPRGLRRRSAAARLLRSWVRIPLGAWMFVECCVLSGRSLCDELITRAEESYRLYCVVVCNLETSRIRRP